MILPKSEILGLAFMFISFPLMAINALLWMVVFLVSFGFAVGVPQEWWKKRKERKSHLLGEKTK